MLNVEYMYSMPIKLQRQVARRKCYPAEVLPTSSHLSNLLLEIICLFLHESACKLLCYVSLRPVPSQNPTITPIEN